MSIAFAFISILSIPLWGYVLLKSKWLDATVIGWLLAIGLMGSIYFFLSADPLTLMFLYITSTFLALKIVVANNHLETGNQLNFMQWLLFCYAWFGMNPLPFKAFPGRSYNDYKSFILKGFSRMIIGVLFISLLRFVFFLFSLYDTCLPLLHLSYLIGLSLILHFGILNVSTGFLRFLGVNVSALFKDPGKSKSLEEFWSKRWNMAFVELTTLAVLRPLKKRFGSQWAFWLSYAFSGLLHELAISLPVNKGFGKPFLYFILQAVFILAIERPFINRVNSVAIRRVWLFTCLFLPIFLLFHPSFIDQIVLPLGNYFSFVIGI